MSLRKCFVYACRMYMYQDTMNEKSPIHYHRNKSIIWSEKYW
jgi:hypothetical protein